MLDRVQRMVIGVRHGRNLIVRDRIGQIVDILEYLSSKDEFKVFDFDSSQLGIGSSGLRLATALEDADAFKADISSLVSYAYFPSGLDLGKSEAFAQDVGTSTYHILKSLGIDEYDRLGFIFEWEQMADEGRTGQETVLDRWGRYPVPDDGTADYANISIGYKQELDGKDNFGGYHRMIANLAHMPEADDRSYHCSFDVQRDFDNHPSCKSVGITQGIIAKECASAISRFSEEAERAFESLVTA